MKSTDDSRDPDRLVAGWSTGRALSQHFDREIVAAFRSSRPLRPHAPVPGCVGCPTCVTLGLGGTWEDTREAEVAVTVLSNLPMTQRLSAAKAWEAERRRLGRVGRLPSPGTLTALADVSLGTGARRKRPAGTRTFRGIGSWDREPMLVEAARAASILEVAGVLGLGEPQRAGHEYRVRCPLHEDTHPSLRLSPAKSVWYCDPCGTGGDAIALVMRTRGCGFAEAVRTIAKRHP
jgi:hypothetical protein